MQATGSDRWQGIKQSSESQPLPVSSIGVELILPTIVKTWRFIVASIVVALLSVYGAFLYYPPLYEVSTSLLLKLGREMDPPATASPTPGVAKRQEDVASEIEILRSQYLLEEMVRHFGVDFFLAETPPQTRFQNRI